MVDISHIFATCDGVEEFSQCMLQTAPGQLTVVTAIDSTPTDT